MSTGAKLVSEIEELLGTKFVPALASDTRHLPRLQHHFIQYPMISEACRSIFGNLVLPEKALVETRPALLRPRVVYGVGIGDLDPFPFDEIKRALLFSDTVALDVVAVYGRANLASPAMPTGHEHSARELLAQMAEKFIRLAEISDLMRANIVLPFSHKEINLPKFRGRTDPLLASQAEAVAYVAKLKEEAEKFTSAEIKSVFYNSFVVGVPTVDAAKVSWAEIKALRENEEIFADWRALMRRILDRLYANKSDWTDLENELLVTARDEVREWSARFETQKMRQPAMAALFGGMREIALNWVGGSVAVAALGTAIGMPVEGLAAGAMAGVANAGRSLIGAMTDVKKALANKEARASLDHHLLVITGQ